MGALVSAVSAALLFRHLGVVDTGHYVTAASLVAIVGALSDLGLTAVGVREISTRPASERWSLAADLLGLRLTLTVLGGAAMVAIAWAAYSGPLAAGVALAIAGLLLQATQDNLAIVLTVDLRLGWISALELTRQLLTTVATLALVALGAGLVPFLGMSIPVGAVVLAATVVLVRGSRSLLPSFSFARWRRFVRPMIPFSLAVAAAALYFRVSILLVSAIGTAGDLGNFSASFRIIEVLTLVPALLVGSAFPIFARAASTDRERLAYGVGKVHEVALIVGTWVAVSIAVGSPLIVKVIGGARFHDAGPVLAIQGIALGTMFVSMVWGTALVSLGVYRQIMVINVAMLAVNAVLVVPATLLAGDRGAAGATAFAEILAAIVQMVAVARLDPRLRAPLAGTWRVALVAAGGLAPLALSPLGVPTIVEIVLSALLFGSLLLALRVVPAEAFDLLPEALAPLRMRFAAR